MTEGSINRVLYNVDQRADTTAAEKKTARDNIGAIGADEVPGIADDRYKLLQIPTSVSYAANAVVSRLEQDAQGVVSLHCSYLTVATESGDGLMSAFDKLKLDGIQAGAETNVQADWAVTDPTSDAFIRNKPDLSVYATQTDLAGKQDTLTAGNNITITNNVISATAAPQEQADWTQADSSAVDYIKHKPDLSQYATQQDLSGKQDTLTAGQNITITNNVISATAAPQQQADWAQADSSAVDYIKNKPQNLVQDANYVHTDNNFTTAEKNKLSGIEAGAQANVQANWNQSSSSADDFIKNKPTIPTSTSQLTNDSGFITASQVPAQVNADWNASSGAAEILHKPTLAAVATSGSYNDLSGKPTIPEITWTQDNQGSSVITEADKLDINQDTHRVQMGAGATTVELGFTVPPVVTAPQEDLFLKMAQGNTVPTWAVAPEGHTVGFINIL